MTTRRSPLSFTIALATGLTAAGLSLGALAAPVDASTDIDRPDPYELALRWALAGLGPTATPSPQAAAPAAKKPLPFSALPGGAGDAGVPAPGAYALMGLGLLAAGLLARHLGRGRQRGLAKKT